MSDRNDSFEFAPVVIHTYTRLEHLKKTIAALLSNDLASSTDLFIASDAPRESKDEHDVLMLRKYIQSIKGFKSVNIILRKKNFGLQLNATMAFEEVYKKTDRLITIEDDTIVGKGFLRYINDGLNQYRDDKNVFAICGYLYKSVSIKSESDAVLLPGFSPWGYGIWKDRLYEVPNHVDITSKFLKNPKLFFKLNLNRPDLVFGLWSVYRHNLVAPDLACLLHMIKSGKKCLFPKKSLVRNIGNDGTGENCIIDISYDDQEYNEHEILFIDKNKVSHNYPSNPFFASHGGWRLMSVNLSKFFLLIVFGEKFYKKVSNFKKLIN